ncbi:MAG: PAS domain-containing sensor histidine kinase, partial [Campylobacterota bacterium]|nr:PAS domain-containing sensor histidine kinase [Campylobacterota bacterium]
EELIGKNHNIIRDPDMKDEVFKELWLTIKSGKTFEGIFKNRNKDGGSYYVKTTILPLYDKNNKINEYIAIRTNITEYVKARDEEADIAEDKTIMLFTHELKTPLNAILSYSSYINRNINKELTPKKIEKISQLVKNIEGNGTSLLSIITSMLDISKFKHNALDVHNEKFNISSLVKDKVKLYDALHTKKITLNIEDNIEVFTDVKSINHIVENLLSNAIKYSSNNISITIENNQDNISFVIEDDGVGIDEESLEKVFKLFSQKSDGRDDKEKTGTGIGLYLVNILVNLNKFSIEIKKSKDLNGACFRLSHIPKFK